MKLYNLDGKWLFVYPDFEIYLISESFEEIRDGIVERIDIEQAEIDLAFTEMRKNGHNCADFGICGMFLFTTWFNTETNTAA